MTTEADKLRAARALIEDPKRWCQCNYAISRLGNSVKPTSKRAVKWCAVGACIKIGASTDLLRDVAICRDIVSTNDCNGHGEVMAMFDRAIQLAEEQEQ